MSRALTAKAQAMTPELAATFSTARRRLRESGSISACSVPCPARLVAAQEWRMLMSKCAFCGHPDSRHRIVDSIREAEAAGDDLDELLAVCGMSRTEFLELEATVEGTNE